MLRLAAGVHVICASAAGRMILTLELVTRARSVATTQFLVAFFLIWRGTCTLSGLGMLVLYLDVTHRYACSMSSTTCSCFAWRSAGLAFSLAWTAIEKFPHPQWMIAVIATHPSIAMGVPVALRLHLAGRGIALDAGWIDLLWLLMLAMFFATLLRDAAHVIACHTRALRDMVLQQLLNGLDALRPQDGPSSHPRGR